MLHNIGKRIKGIKGDATRGLEPYKLAGSHKLPTYATDKPPAPVKITRCEPFQDKRFLPDADAVPHFDAYLPGIDPETGRPWR
jgi:hypothetical protein